MIRNYTVLSDQQPNSEMVDEEATDIARCCCTWVPESRSLTVIRLPFNSKHSRSHRIYLKA